MAAVGVTGTAESAAAVATAEAAVMLAAADPAAVGRPLPVVQVVEGETNESLAPVRPGAPFRVRLRPEVLAATPVERRFALGHELSHVCRGDVVRRVEIQWPVWVSTVVTVAVVWWLAGAVVRPAYTHGRLGPVLAAAAAVLVVGVGVILGDLGRRARRTRVAEAATDQFVVEVFGAVVTEFDLDRWERHKPRFVIPGLRTHPRPHERYEATNAAARVSGAG